MIFSGGLVKAYKLEQITSHPIIAIDKAVIERLNKNFNENSQNLFYDNIFIYSDNESEKIFLNPFDLLDNSSKHLDYLQSTFDELIKENEDDSDPISEITNSLLKMANSFTKPIFDYAKSQMTPENMNFAKETILKYIEEQIEKHELILSKISKIKTKNRSNLFDRISFFSRKKTESKEVAEIKKIISKYEFLKSLTKWSLGQAAPNTFKYFKFKNN